MVLASLCSRDRDGARRGVDHAEVLAELDRGVLRVWIVVCGDLARAPPRCAVSSDSWPRRRSPRSWRRPTGGTCVTTMELPSMAATTKTAATHQPDDGQLADHARVHRAGAPSRTFADPRCGTAAPRHPCTSSTSSILKIRAQDPKASTPTETADDHGHELHEERRGSGPRERRVTRPRRQRRQTPRPEASRSERVADAAPVQMPPRRPRRIVAQDDDRRTRRRARTPPRAPGPPSDDVA